MAGGEDAGAGARGVESRSGWGRDGGEADAKAQRGRLSRVASPHASSPGDRRFFFFFGFAECAPPPRASPTSLPRPRDSPRAPRFSLAWRATQLDCIAPPGERAATQNRVAAFATDGPATGIKYFRLYLCARLIRYITLTVTFDSRIVYVTVHRLVVDHFVVRDT